MSRSLWLFALLSLVVAGCSSSPNRSSSRDGSSTGEMGGEESHMSPANTFIALATEYMRKGNMNAALNNARKAEEADPRSTNAQTVLALVYQRLGENNLASQHFEKALSIDSKDSYALNAYGDFSCKIGEYDKAMSLFDRALANPLYDKPWVAHSNAGACARQHGHNDRAIEHFNHALGANPNDLKSLENMAGLSMASGNALSARGFVERYRELAKPTAEVLAVGAEAERALGNPDKARSYEMLLKSDYPSSTLVQPLNRRN